MSASGDETSWPSQRASLLATLAIGIGMMAALDEIVFHQVLAWHHFFDFSTDAFALASDGLLHSGELILLVAGFFRFAELRRRRILGPTAAWSGFWFGMGAFQLFDGIIDHKVLHLHQIRYVDELWLYDLGWNLAGAAMIALGVALLRRARRLPGRPPHA